MVAMGGFVSAPAVIAARAERIPIVLVNLDASPGKANRFVARLAGRIFSTYPDAFGPSRSVIGIAPIVRSNAIAHEDQSAARAALGLRSDLPTLVVLGGSQGARTINRCLAELARREPSLFEGWQVFHQTGELSDADRSSLESAYAEHSVSALIVPLSSDMSRVWASADLALCRAGAGTVAEVWANAVPAVFLPYPYHRDEHQRLNAAPLEHAGGARIVRDQIDAGANADTLAPLLSELVHDASPLHTMRASLRNLGPADGAARVAAALLEGR
jgi:UDP-N-acetylglucosamine--N-acetylmuramyl-(pentapeptide) pyrophosphoryl-undecaprenol N-acetylglucosamine transferase